MEKTYEMEKNLGILVVYSLNADLEINWETLYEKGKKMGIEKEDIPLPTPARRNLNILTIKEIRRAILKFLEKCRGISIRESGGVVFIPKYFLCEWLQYSKFLTEFNGIEIVNIDVYETTANKKMIAQALIEDIRGRLKVEIKKVSDRTAKGNIKELSSSLALDLGTKKMSDRALEFMRERMNSTVNKVDLFEKVLEMDMEYVRKELNVVRNIIRNSRGFW